MKKIDFKNVEIYTDIQHKEKIIADMHIDFSNIIYQRGSGIQAHALAMKIYNATEPQEYSEDECKLIMDYANLCNPFFIDAIKTILETE